MRRRIYWIRVAVAAAAVTVVAASTASASAKAPGDNRYQQNNLVADQPGKAVLTDPNLVNAWGMSRGPNTPVWVSDNGSDVATLYRGAVGTTAVSVVPLVVQIPGGAPTGQIFNDTTGFTVPGTTAPALFAFAGENGDLSAWNGSVSPSTQAVSVGHTAGAVYKGLALAHSPFGPLLLATNFHDNRIDVFNSQFQLLSVPGLFSDPRLPSGFAPFNVAEIDGKIFVTYAKQDAARHDDVAGLGNGFIDVYTTYGVLLHRLVSRGLLNSPWGMTIAPANFGAFSGDLLVGNFGDGRIHAFDPNNGRLLGTLRAANGLPLAIDGLWGLLVGDATAGGPDAVWFSAGPDGEAHGLLGTLSAA
jgi:uncharacterized protein (TIGR03118 family)